MNNTKKILVTGSRKIADETSYKMLKNILDDLKPIMLLHGGAMGADSLAARYAETEKLETEVIRPDYITHGKYAPLKRNTKLVAKAEICVAMYANERIRKGGTWDTVKKALAAGIETHEIMPCGRTEVTAAKLLLL